MPGELSRPAALWRSLRPHQWVKNVLVFGGLAFTGRWHRATSGGGAAAMLDLHAIGIACGAFVVFCLLSSAGYLVNDILDRESDRQHPTKCKRPIAAGVLPLSTAWAAAAVLFVLALAGAAAL
ncbi:MAG: UbiA family prenyltransferase, partial [Armatimonadetes bacterium]|nr:UbiA family prenyltransferase [Armatimonadota bacterium]